MDGESKYFRNLQISQKSQRPQSDLFTSFAKKALFLPQMLNNEENKALEIFHNLYNINLQQYTDSKRRVWPGSLPKSFRNHYLDLQNDHNNLYRSERVSQLVEKKSQYRMDNFLDEVLKPSQKQQQVYTDNIKQELLDDLFFNMRSKKVDEKYSEFEFDKRKSEFLKLNNQESSQTCREFSVKYIGVHNDKLGITSRKIPFSKIIANKGVTVPFAEKFDKGLIFNFTDKKRVKDLQAHEASQVLKKEQCPTISSLKKQTQNTSVIIERISPQESQNKTSHRSMMDLGEIQNQSPINHNLIPKPLLYDIFLVNKYIIGKSLKVGRRSKTKKYQNSKNSSVLK